MAGVCQRSPNGTTAAAGFATSMTSVPQLQRTVRRRAVLVILAGSPARDSDA
jgi:hypothetical protein